MKTLCRQLYMHPPIIFVSTYPAVRFIPLLSSLCSLLNFVITPINSIPVRLIGLAPGTQVPYEYDNELVVVSTTL
jgi:hypothetical protein